MWANDNDVIDIDTGDVSVMINHLFTHLGDTVNQLNLTLTSVNELVTNLVNLTDITHQIDISHVVENITNIVEILSQTVDNSISTIAETLTGITGELTSLTQNILTGNLDGIKGLALDVDLEVDSLISVNTDISLQNLLNGDIGVHVDVSNLNNLIGQLGDLPVIGELGEVVGQLTTITDGLATTLETLGDKVDHLPDEVVDSVTEVTTGLINTVTEITGQIDSLLGEVSDAPDLLTDIADHSVAPIADGLLGGVLGETANHGDGAGDSDLTAQTGVEVIDHALAEVAVEAVINPVEDLVGDVDVAGDLGIDLLGNNQTDNSEGDHDIVLTPDVDLVDTDILGGAVEVELDAVEAVIGDVDLDVGAAINVLGDQADNVVNDAPGGTGEDTLLANLGDALSDIATLAVPGVNGSDTDESDLTVDAGIEALDNGVAVIDTQSVLDPAEAVIGDVDTEVVTNADLLGDNETDNSEGDSDILADFDVNLAGHDVAEVELDIPLDVVEQITGDIDLEINSVLDLLASDDSENNNSGGDQADDSGWTETTIIDGGGLFGDLAGSVDALGGLPDPTSTVAEGLGVLNVGGDGDAASGGGLFG